MLTTALIHMVLPNLDLPVIVKKANGSEYVMKGKSENVGDISKMFVSISNGASITLTARRVEADLEKEVSQPLKFSLTVPGKTLDGAIPRPFGSEEKVFRPKFIGGIYLHSATSESTKWIISSYWTAGGSGSAIFFTLISVSKKSIRLLTLPQVSSIQDKTAFVFGATVESNPGLVVAWPTSESNGRAGPARYHGAVYALNSKFGRNVHQFFTKERFGTQEEGFDDLKLKNVNPYLAPGMNAYEMQFLPFDPK